MRLQLEFPAGRRGYLTTQPFKPSCTVINMKYHLLTVIVALSAVLIIHVIPMDAHAEVKSFTLAKSTYDTDVDETFTIVGNIAADRQSVYVIIRDSIGNHRGLLASPTTDADGSFTTIPKKINSIFKSDGWYNATAFTAAQKEEDGRTMQIKFENGLLFTIPDFTLKIQEIPDQRVNEGDVLSFVVGVTDRSIEDVRYRLGDVIQQGATINESTGEFRWTPGFDKGTTGGAMYSFEVVASKPPLEDKRNFMVIVFNQAVATPAAPESSESNDVPTGTTTTSATSATTPTTTSTPTLDVLEIPAPFVDEGTDPQVYVDRYNDEPAFREWFDVTYAGEYGSIYNAVGLPEIPAPFVDEGTDPQVYVDRYNDEPAFREWFDATYAG